VVKDIKVVFVVCSIFEKPVATAVSSPSQRIKCAIILCALKIVLGMSGKPGVDAHKLVAGD